MFRTTRLLFVVAVIVGLLTCAVAANAILTNFLTSSFATNTTRNEWTGSVGYQFTPTEDIIITALGRPVFGSMANNHLVRIWRESDQALVASATVTPASATGTLGYKYASLDQGASVTLTSGTVYRIASNETQGGDLWMDNASISGAHLPNATVGLPCYGVTGEYPDGTQPNPGNAYVPPTFFGDFVYTAAPAFSVAPGIYTSDQSVTITSATAGASIRYTLDGTTPTATTGTLYTGPVTVNHSLTLKAIAYKSGMVDSTVTSGSYTIYHITWTQVGGSYGSYNTPDAWTDGTAFSPVGTLPSELGVAAGLLKNFKVTYNWAAVPVHDWGAQKVGDGGLALFVGSTPSASLGLFTGCQLDAIGSSNAGAIAADASGGSFPLTGASGQGFDVTVMCLNGVVMTTVAGVNTYTYTVTPTDIANWAGKTNFASFHSGPGWPSPVVRSSVGNITFYADQSQTTPPAGNIAGHVTTNFGTSHPVAADATVTVTDSANAQVTNATDANGDYSITGLAPGTYTVAITKAKCEPASTPGVVVVDKGTAVANFDLTTSFIKGRITSSASGSPAVAGVTVQIVGGDAVTTDSAGNYSHQVSSGVYTLAIHKYGFLPVTNTITVGVGSTVTNNITLVPGWDFAGDVAPANPNVDWSYRFNSNTVTDGIMTTSPAAGCPGNSSTDLSIGSADGGAPVFAKRLGGFATTTMGGAAVSRETQKVVAGMGSEAANQAIARWTAPTSGVFAVSARWAGANASAQAYAGIRKNGAYVWGGPASTQIVNGFQGTSANNFSDSSGVTPVVTHSQNVLVTVGDTVDAAASYLADGSWVQLDMNVATATSGVGTISGVVRSDLPGNNPILGARVEITGGEQPFIATTAIDGSYTLTVPIGNYDITVSATGYSDDTTVSGLNVTDGRSITKNYTLAFGGTWDFVQDYTTVCNPFGQWALYSGSSLCQWGPHLGYFAGGVTTWGSMGATNLDFWSGWFYKNTSGAPIAWTSQCPPDYLFYDTGYLETNDVTNQIIIGGAGRAQGDIRWTSPDQRVIKIDLTFASLEPHADQLGLQIRKNGSVLITKSVKGFVGRYANGYTDSVGPAPRASGMLNLLVNTGDTIDFVTVFSDNRPAIGITNLQISHGTGVPCANLTAVKNQTVGTTVFLTTPTVAVCESYRFNDYSFYLESGDRSQGVKCIGSADLPTIDFGDQHDQGKSVTLTGVVIADPYDATKKALRVQSINSIDAGSIPKPLGLTSKALTSTMAGQNMAVKVWGKVVQRVANTDPATNTNWPWLYWIISDGGVNVKVPMIGQSGWMTSTSLLAIQDNDYISVVGVQTVDSTGTLVVYPWAEGNIADYAGR